MRFAKFVFVAAGVWGIAVLTPLFSSIRTEAAERLAEALNGLGSVAAVRGSFRAALGWIDKALALVPGYPAALSDRTQVVAALRAEPSKQSLSKAKVNSQKAKLPYGSANT